MPTPHEVFKTIPADVARWWTALDGGGRRGTAVARNLKEERRIEPLHDYALLFQDAAARFAGGTGPREALREALEARPGWRHLRRLSGSESAPKPPHVHLETIESLQQRGCLKAPGVDPDDPPTRLEIFGPGEARWREFVWVIFVAGEGDRPLSWESASQARDQLGLEHFGSGKIICRIELGPCDAGDLRVPLFPDSNGDPFWRPMPPDAPWGRTVDLRDGSRPHPELLRKTPGSVPDAEVVSARSGEPSRTGDAPEGYLDAL